MTRSSRRQAVAGRARDTDPVPSWAAPEHAVLQLQRAVGNRAVGSLLASRAPGPVVQRMRSNYAIVLPPDEQHRLNGLVRDDTYPQSSVDSFVDGLKRSQMDFFDSSTAALLESARWPKADVTDPFGGRAPVTLWQCPNCKQATTYQGVDRGHITSWKDELKKAGVKNLAEANLAYNNLLNLRLECRSCNVSHAFERGTSGTFTDVPTQEDFGSGKAAKQRREEFMEGYGDLDMDAYDLTDPFIDTTPTQKVILVTQAPITLTEDKGGTPSGGSTTFRGAQVRLTGKTHGSGWVEVLVIESRDFNLRNNIKAWATVDHLKTGEVREY
jgi:HNH/ENDO VII superfamily nuclease with conserved GHE residues